MRFVGTEQECAEIIAQLDAAHGYPRGYTQADVGSGLVVRVGGGIHVPLELLRTETIAAPIPATVDERGQPIGDERVVHLPPIRDDHRAHVARARVLRLLNRGSRAALVAIDGIGPTRADAIIALRASGRMTSIEDVRRSLPAAAVTALRAYAATKMGDEDAVEAAALAAGKAKS